MKDDRELFSLEDKIVVVTGGTRRYGHCFCRALGQAGATVVLTSRDRGRADDTARELAIRAWRRLAMACSLLTAVPLKRLWTRSSQITGG